ncbi:MAG: DUF342 domain-containing protein [Desulfamplus sp.]|nr:DUF342 domain-containing protein [Desulfamplus sp.]
MKQPENNIPSFAALAIKYDMINQDQLSDAYRFMEKKKSEAEPCSLEYALLTNKAITRQQVDLVKALRDFLTVRKKSELFGYIAVEKGYATQKEIKSALARQQQLFREKRVRKMVGDILVESGILTRTQQRIIADEQKNAADDKNIAINDKSIAVAGDQQISVSEQNRPVSGTDQHADKLKKINPGTSSLPHQSRSSPHQFRSLPHQSRITKESEKEEPKNIAVEVTPDKMEAWVKIIYNNPSPSDSSVPWQPDSLVESSTELKTKLVTPADIKTALEKKGVRTGILRDAVLQCHIDQKQDFFPAAFGEYIYSKTLEYQFNFDKTASDITFKKNRSVASVDSGDLNIKGKDIFGNSVEFPDLPLFRCGKGVFVSEDGTQAISLHSGYPAISLDGRLYIFPVINVLGDADTHFGQIEPYASVNVSGTLTGAYSVNAGQIKAGEIRGATISSIGDIAVEVGINRSRIKTQGNLYAKYIHNSRVESFGDVFVEHEIIDSTIIISGKCHAPKSRIIASRISAKGGIVAAGVGSDVTEPCLLAAGGEEHIALMSRQITDQIRNARKELDELMESKSEMEHNIKEIFRKMVELKAVHDRARSAAVEYSQHADISGHTNKKTTPLIDDLKLKMATSVDEIKKYNAQKKELESDLEKTANTIKELEPGVEKQIMELEMDRNLFFKWADSRPSVPEIKVSGRISQGTRVKGIFSSITVHEDIRNSTLVERKNKRISGTDPGFEHEILVV